jgi:DNA-binding response OmpR family regulator
MPEGGNLANMLVVEPHEQVNGLIARLLKQAGHTVVCAVNSIEGEKQFRNQDFALVMGDGPNTVTWLEQLYADGQTVLVITGTITCGLPSLIKPFRSEDLINRVSELLQSATD